MKRPKIPVIFWMINMQSVLIMIFAIINLAVWDGDIKVGYVLTTLACTNVIICIIGLFINHKNYKNMIQKRERERGIEMELEFWKEKGIKNDEIN